MAWVNMKCDGSIETSGGLIPRDLHRAADVYAAHKVAEAVAAFEALAERKAQQEAATVTTFGLFDYSTLSKLRNPLKKLGIKLSIRGRRVDDQSTLTLEKVSKK